MKYIQFRYDGVDVVTALGGASRKSDGSVHIWGHGEDSDAGVWVIKPGPEAEAAWHAVFMAMKYDR